MIKSLVRLILIYGNDHFRKEKFIDELKKQNGDFAFSDNIKNIPSLCDWVIFKENFAFVPKFWNRYNILIHCLNLFEVPIEIRLKSEIYLMEKPFHMPKTKQKKTLLWQLLMEKFIPQDIQKRQKP